MLFYHASSVKLQQNEKDVSARHTSPSMLVGTFDETHVDDAVIVIPGTQYVPGTTYKAVGIRRSVYCVL